MCEWGMMEVEAPWPFDGLIDEVRVYNVVLCPSQIAQRYKNAEPIGVNSSDTQVYSDSLEDR